MTRFAAVWLSTLFMAMPIAADTIVSAQLYRSVDYDDQFAGHFLPFPLPDGNFRECGEVDGDVVYRTVAIEEVEEAVGTCPEHSGVYALITYSYSDFSALAPGTTIADISGKTDYGTVLEVLLKDNGDFAGVVTQAPEGGGLTYLDPKALATWGTEAGPKFTVLPKEDQIKTVPPEFAQTENWRDFISETYGVNGLSTSLDSGAISANGTISIPGLNPAPLR